MSQKVMKKLNETLLQIEHEKMMAVGKRNAVENEYDYRRRRLGQLQTLLKEKEVELHQIHDRHESLVRVLRTQEKEIEKIKGF